MRTSGRRKFGSTGFFALWRLSIVFSGPYVYCLSRHPSLEMKLSDPTLDRIEKELQLLNVNLAEANDIAILAAYTPVPADLDTDSRKALRRLRDKMMLRAQGRADA